MTAVDIRGVVIAAEIGVIETVETCDVVVWSEGAEVRTADDRGAGSEASRSPGTERSATEARAAEAA